MLQLKRVGINMRWESIAFINRDCTLFRPEEFQAMRRVVVRTQEGGRLYATLAIVDDPRIVACDELGLSERAFELLGAPEAAQVTIDPEVAPPSLDAVRAKIHGATFSDAQIHDIIGDISANRYSEMEIAAFLVSSASFMSTDEVLSMTRAMAEAGNRLTWPQTLVVDKHSIGGIPNNRTSMIVVPIVAAHGLTIPKTSSRAITSPAGTSDTMEVLARVDLDADEMRRVVETCNGCLIWGGHVNLSPADDILISVERPLRIDTIEQMVASILSKKLAAGSTHLLLDIPVGPSAKVRSQVEAVRVRKLFEHVARQIGLTLEVMITAADQPIGRGVGPVLEARDVMSVLEGRPDAPLDLRDKSLLLAGALIEFDPALRGGSGLARARELLDNGAALKSMQAMIEAQGAHNGRFVLGSYMKDVCAARPGRIGSIHCQRINRIARLAGAPMDKGAGLDLFKRLGDHVDAGEPLYRIHSCVPFNFDFACEAAAEFSGYRLAEE